MSEVLSDAERALADALANSMRGPRRNGTYAVWLLVRIVGDLVGPEPPSERNHRRRVTSLDRRLRSLHLPAGIRRVLPGVVGTLADASPDAAAKALSLLLPATRDSLGPGCAEAVEAAAARVRTVVTSRDGLSPSRPPGRDPFRPSAPNDDLGSRL